MPRTVLVVDDSATMRRMLRETLRGAGFEVLECGDGQQVRARVAGRRVDLVITDFNMPVVGGPELVARLRATPEFRFTPIILLTTESDPARKDEGRAAGATGWMVKPFDPAKLIEVVNRLAA